MKASTGAWWKSAAPQENPDAPETAVIEPAAEPAAAGEEGPDASAEPVKAPRKRASRKRSAPQKEAEAEEAAAEEVPVQEPEKKPRKRPPRKRTAKKDAVPEPLKETPEAAGPQQAAEPVNTEEVAAVSLPGQSEVQNPAVESGDEAVGEDRVSSEEVVFEEVVSEETAPEQAAAVAPAAGEGEKRKSGRSRRGRRGHKKTEEAKAEAELSEDVDDEDQDVPEAEEPDQQEMKDGPKPVRKLLINAEEPEECRLALLEDGRLESIYVSTVTRTHTKNNIYKARIVALEANLQAAFVDYGTEKNGFLPFGEIHPEYYRQNVSEKSRKLIEQHQWKKLSITDVLEKGQEVLVQVVKEEIGTKGANMTTYLSLPGRCVVLLPGSDSSGISRKISGEEMRTQLRDIMESMSIPEGIGWIVRTASSDINKAALSRDVTYLLRLWSEVKKKGQDMEGVGLIYQDHDSVLRFLREHFDSSIEEILVDDQAALEQVKGFVELLPAKQRTVRVKLHRGSRPIFNQYSVEDQIESIYQPRVNLPSGGSIVIDQTEALVAIDVNSGSTSKGQNFEASIFQANMEAASELARQLRLRDLGGLVVVDFIDMRLQKNIREVEKQVKISMKRDKAKVDISRISKFGLMQISRQKLGAPIDAGNYRVCEHCKGRGTVRSVETLALFYLRRIQTGASRKQVRLVECHFPLDVAQYLLNNKRQELLDLENRYETEISIITSPSLKPSDNEIIFHKIEKESPAKKQA
ncbi:MAG: Rne/Rng family ribonuclease [Desulfocapsaceae bacterium]|nr:Rne/Rng family ribonuclease [Desulfocapsaceae bacterium]